MPRVSTAWLRCAVVYCFICDCIFHLSRKPTYISICLFRLRVLYQQNVWSCMLNSVHKCVYACACMSRHSESSLLWRIPPHVSTAFCAVSNIRESDRDWQILCGLEELKTLSGKIMLHLKMNILSSFTQPPCHYKPFIIVLFCPLRWKSMGSRVVLEPIDFHWNILQNILSVSNFLAESSL